MYEIKIEDVKEDFYKDKNSKFFDPVNEKVIGKINDEKKKIISKFVGLKSKPYSLIAVDSEEVKQAKGENKNVAQKIRHKEFVDCCLIKK